MHHDELLLSLADRLEHEGCEKRPAGTELREAITFIKEGARLSKPKDQSPNGCKKGDGVLSWEGGCTQQSIQTLQCRQPKSGK